MKLWFFIFPGLVGITIFYFLPGIVTFYYAFTDARGYFVWFANFIEVISSTAFRLADRNSVRFILTAVPITLFVALFLALLTKGLKHKNILAVVLLLPMVLPSSATVFFWNVVFSYNGVVNNMLHQFDRDTAYWLSSEWAFVVIVIIFLFRNMGFGLILFIAGLQLIPKGYYDIAKIE
jgi:multiple sugar transport system permease protein